MVIMVKSLNSTAMPGLELDSGQNKCGNLRSKTDIGDRDPMG